MVKDDVRQNIEAALEFFDDVAIETAKLKENLHALQTLEKEYEFVQGEARHANLQAQAALLDDILERYEFFQTDADINGLRVKKLGEKFLKRSKKEKAKELYKDRKKKWNFIW